MLDAVTIYEAIKMMFLLLVGHAVADFALQTETMAKLKSFRNQPILPEGQRYVPVWKFWLVAHGLIHGGFVFLVTGYVSLGIIETVAHCGIDYLKCANKTDPNQDQFLHVLTKVAYVLYLV